MNAIETHGLSRSFWGRKAVNGLDLAVPEGSIYAFLGPNGAGKTTTIKMLMNLLRPSSGSATVLGTPSTKLRGRAFETIGYVSEDQELPGWMTVGRFLAYLQPFYPEWDRDLCGQLLERLQLPLETKLKHLSRGMRMKAKLISSLVYRPRLLVLDEPFSGLDVLVRDQLLEGILSLAAQEGTTVFMSSHDLGEVENLCSHIGFLGQGRLRLSEDLDTLRDRVREVEVLFAEAPSGLPELPSDWLDPQLEGRTLRFVHRRFDPDTLEREVRGFFPGSLEIQPATMTLRQIFLAFAKTEAQSAFAQVAA
jgi:ABC-type multidrug transport system ATPase subunit